ncbi:MAG: NTP transferase domain-containing protein [Pseudomonadota bacterium]
MIAAEDAVLVLLAAGGSRRFGAANKLEVEFLGKPLGLHVVTALEDMPFGERVAVIDDCSLDFAGRDFTVLHNPDAARGMAGSLRVGVKHAQARGAAAVVVALADMPRVTSSHIYHLLEAADATDAVVASSDGVSPRPPALFGRDRFDFLLTLDGDTGARDLIRAGKHVVTTPAELIDIDTPDDLARLQSLVHDRRLTRDGG